MSKIKDFILTIVEDYQNGLSVQQISNIHGISIPEVLRIIEQYS